jgi:hypothetical protein
MGLDLSSRRVVAGTAALGFLAALAGCQAGDTVGALDLGLRKNNTQNTEGMVRESELRAYCPRVTLREGTSTYRSFERKAEEDPTKLLYLASITDVTRACTYTTPGFITVNVALAGKVVPGPKAQAGTVTMPIRVVATRGGEVLYSQLYQHPVTINQVGASQFIFNDPNVSVPSITDGSIQIYAGYDEGPVPKKVE